MTRTALRSWMVRGEMTIARVVRPLLPLFVAMVLALLVVTYVLELSL